MAKKALAQTVSATGGSAPAPAKRTSRTRSAKATSEAAPKATPEIEAPATAQEIAVAAVTNVADAHDAIAKLAYSYWEERCSLGVTQGSMFEDWLRAEHAYHSKHA